MERTEVGRWTRQHSLIAQGGIAMNDQNRRTVRILVATAALLAALALLALQSSAEDLTSASYRLRGGTLSGGGGVDREQPPAPRFTWRRWAW